jgi:hypothetical protein
MINVQPAALRRPPPGSPPLVARSQSARARRAQIPMCGHRVAQAHIELASHPRSERLEMRLRRSRGRNTWRAAGRDQGGAGYRTRASVVRDGSQAPEEAKQRSATGWPRAQRRIHILTSDHKRGCFEPIMAVLATLSSSATFVLKGVAMEASKSAYAAFQ